VSPDISNSQLASFLKVVALLRSLSSNSHMANHATQNAHLRSLQPNPTDIITKRQKNTDAARRSRQRKLLRMEALEHKVRQLEMNNQQLQSHIKASEQQRNQSAARVASGKERVKELEAQLAAVHVALMET
ncbi:hypothetical protein BDF14DRAFT_1704406, partial [Spinellus fusiger]